MAVRLRDVAAHAGVSATTVSNVVHGHPSVSRGIRARVQASIDALGYMPNIPARSLRTGRSGLIGLAVPRVGDPYFAAVAAAVIDAAAGRGISVLIEQTDGDPAREIDVLQGRRPTIVDGLIFSPISVSREALDEAAPAIPIILLGEHLMASQRARVAIDNLAASAEAVAHLLTSGRRRVAAVGVKHGQNAASAQLRLAGYRAALTGSGVELDAALEVPAEHFSRAGGRAAVTTLLDKGVHFDALFCFNDLLALGALEALRERGLSVPGEIAVVGFDNIEEAAHATPGLTSVSPDLSALASAAVANLLHRLDEPDAEESVSVVVPHRLVVRGSTSTQQDTEPTTASSAAIA